MYAKTPHVASDAYSNIGNQTELQSSLIVTGTQALTYTQNSTFRCSQYIAEYYKEKPESGLLYVSQDNPFSNINADGTLLLELSFTLQEIAIT